MTKPKLIEFLSKLGDLLEEYGVEYIAGSTPYNNPKFVFKDKSEYIVDDGTTPFGFQISKEEPNIVDMYWNRNPTPDPHYLDYPHNNF